MKARWVPLAAAAATLVIAGTVFAIVSTRSDTVDGPRAEPPASAAATAAPTAAPLKPEDLVVRDGTEVEASGTVIARPGKPVQFCGPGMDTGFRLPGDEGLPGCGFGITVVGVDLDSLTEPGTAGGSRFGRAYLRGVWQAGTLTVTAQAPPVREPPAQITWDTPCPPPGGGWKPGGNADSNELHQYVYDEHPDQFRPLYVTYPNGIPAGPSPPGDAAMVMVVEVVRGDVYQARAELQRRYAGNLCVVERAGRPSIADLTKLEEDMRPTIDGLMRDQTNGISAVGFGDTFRFELVMVTPALYDTFSQIGFDLVELDPWLRPVR